MARAEELPVLSSASTQRSAELALALSDSDADVFVVDGGDTTDKPAIMARMAADLGFDDPPSSWDGLADTLWGHLARSTADHAVIIWNGADGLITAGFDDFLQLVTLFNDLARTLNTRSPRPLHLHVVFSGDGPSFTS